MNVSYMGVDKAKMEKLIKAAGSELIRRAGELAEGVERFNDLDIWIMFSDDEIPYIDVTKRYVNTEMLKVIAGIDEE